MKQQKEVRQTFKTVSTFNGKPFVARVGFDVGPTDDVKVGLPKTRDSALPDVKELEEPLFSFIVKAWGLNRLNSLTGGLELLRVFGDILTSRSDSNGTYTVEV